MNGCCGSKPISMMLLNQIGGSVAPSAPTASAATNITDVSFTSNIAGAVSGATGYYQYLFTSDGTTLISKIDIGNNLLKANAGLTQNTTYKYAFSAYNSGGESALSVLMPVVTYDANAQLFIATLTTPTIVDKTAINQVILDLKTGLVNGTDNWNDGASIQLLATLTQANQLKNAKTIGTQALTLFGSPTSTIDGIVLNGTTQHLKSGYDNTGISINNFAKFVFVKDEVILNSFVTYLSTVTSNEIAVERNNSTGGIGTWALAGGAATARTPGVVSGLVGVGRKDSSTKGKYIDSVLTEYADTRTAAAPTVETNIGIYPDGSEQLKGTVSFIWEGLYRTAAQFADLVAAVNKYSILRAGGLIGGILSGYLGGTVSGINWGTL